MQPCGSNASRGTVILSSGGGAMIDGYALGGFSVGEPPEAMREAVSSGRKAYLAGRIAVKEYGSASSPQERFESRGQANPSGCPGLPVP